MKTIYLLFFLAFSYTTATATSLTFTEVTTEAEWQKLLSEASKNKQVIFVDVYTDWCGYCKKLDREVYTDEAFVSFQEKNFINVKIDAEAGYGITFAQEQEVNGYPTLLFMDGQSNILSKIPGYADAVTLQEAGEGILNIQKNITTWEADYASNSLTPDAKKKYAEALKQLGDEEKANRVATSYFDGLSDDSFATTETVEFAQKFGLDLDGAVYSKILSKKEDIDPEVFSDYLQSVYNENLLNAMRTKNITLVESVIKNLLPQYLGTYSQEDLLEGAFFIRKSYYKGISDWATYQKLVIDYYEAYKKGESEFFATHAVAIIQDGYQEAEVLDIAIRWLDKEIEISGSGFESILLKSYTLGVAGNIKDAIENAEQALKLADDDEKKEMANDLLAQLRSAEEE